MHLGHYKALVVLVALEEDSLEGKQFYKKQKFLFTLVLNVINLAISNGYALQRWCKATNVMLEKDPGSPKLTRLRVIHLFEADYNLVLGQKWKELMEHCEKQNYIHTNQFGSRRLHCSIDLPAEREEMYV